MFICAVPAARACLRAAALCPSEQHAVQHEETHLPKRGMGLQDAWSCGLIRVNKTRTEQHMLYLSVRNLDQWQHA